MTELKPCPFCGSDDCYVAKVGSIPRYEIFCPDCCASGPASMYEEKAMEKWNDRKG